jgi:hypothetical protein
MLEELVFLVVFTFENRQTVLAKWPTLGRVAAELCACHVLSPHVGKLPSRPPHFYEHMLVSSLSLSLSHSPLSFLTHMPSSPTPTPRSHGCRWLALAVAPPQSNYPSRALNLLRRCVLKPWRLLPELDGPQTRVVDTTTP